MAHPGDKGRCLIAGYIECASIIDAGCICEKFPPHVAKAYYWRKYGNPDEEISGSNLVTAAGQSPRTP